MAKRKRHAAAFKAKAAREALKGEQTVAELAALHLKNQLGALNAKDPLKGSGTWL